MPKSNISRHNQRLTQRERTEAARKAGKASAAARQERRTIKETLLAMLAMPSTIRPEMDASTSLCLSMLEEAQRGSVAAAAWVRDSAGEKPIERTSNDHTNSDGSFTKGAQIDLTGWTAAEITAACGAVFGEDE